MSKIHLKPIIGPAAELHDASLFVKASSSSSWLAWYCHHRNGHHQGRVDHHYHIHHLYLKPIIGPAAKLHDTSLFIKREVLHIHLTGTMIDSWWSPLHLSSAVKRCLGGKRHLKITISTEIIFIIFISFSWKKKLQRNAKRKIYLW